MPRTLKQIVANWEHYGTVDAQDLAALVRAVRKHDHTVAVLEGKVLSAESDSRRLMREVDALRDYKGRTLHRLKKLEEEVRELRKAAAIRGRETGQAGGGAVSLEGENDEGHDREHRA